MSARQRRKREKQRRHAGASKRLAVGAGLTVGATLGFGASADAANFEVDTTLDPGGAGACSAVTVGDCSLRQAVALSNSTAAVDDTITFAATLTGNTIAVASGEILITDDVYLYTNVADVSVSAGTSSRIFDINATGDPGMNVGIYSLTLTQGYSSNYGGAIYSRSADLIISNSTVSDSSTTGLVSGGAIDLRYGSLTIQGSEISGNSSGSSGGAIYAQGSTLDPTTVQISDSTITGNSTSNGGDGGGLSAYRSTTAIENSTISGNSTSGDSGFGGGIHSALGEITVEGSTISGNSTEDDHARGGGLASRVNTTTIESSTVSGNSTAGLEADGGGVFATDGTLAIRNSTIADNHVYGYANGGGVFATYVSPDPVLTNTIVADNSASGTGPDVFSPVPADTFQAAFTLVEDTQNSVIKTTVPGSNIFGVDPGLQPLADNGTLNGTETHALSLSSPVIDCGSSGSAATDQRGLPRPVDLSGRTNSTAAGANGADMGAFELQAGSPTGACPNNAPPGPTPATPAPAPAPAPIFNLKAAIKKCKKKFRKGPKRAKCVKKAKRKAHP
jgi:predicted outer membrane repeat protein